MSRRHALAVPGVGLMIYAVMKDFAGPFATIVAAVVAVGVTGHFARQQSRTAYQQWQTTREKLLLDLFDKRFGTYDELRSALYLYGIRGNEQTAYIDFSRAVSRARFLFGPEVQTFLEERRMDLDREMTLRTLQRPVPENRIEAVDTEIVDIWHRVARFSKDFDQLVAPYMNHHQKGATS